MTKWSELMEKEIICCHDGSRLGYAEDMVLDECSGKILSLLVPAGGKFCGIFGAGEEYVIQWSEIERIGEDIILVNKVIEPRQRDRKKY